MCTCPEIFWWMQIILFHQFISENCKIMYTIMRFSDQFTNSFCCASYINYNRSTIMSSRFIRRNIYYIYLRYTVQTGCLRFITDIATFTIQILIKDSKERAGARALWCDALNYSMFSLRLQFSFQERNRSRSKRTNRISDYFVICSIHAQRNHFVKMVCLQKIYALCSAKTIHIQAKYI